MVQTVDTVYEHVKDRTQDRPQSQFQETFLQPLIEKGWITVDDFGLVGPTQEGMLAYKAALAEQDDAKVRANLYVPPAGIYSGSELGRTCHRPGAYDFQKHPSIINGKPVERAAA